MGIGYQGRPSQANIMFSGYLVAVSHARRILDIRNQIMHLVYTAAHHRHTYTFTFTYTLSHTHIHTHTHKHLHTYKYRPGGKRSGRQLCRLGQSPKTQPAAGTCIDADRASSNRATSSAKIAGLSIINAASRCHAYVKCAASCSEAHTVGAFNS